MAIVKISKSKLNFNTLTKSKVQDIQKQQIKDNIFNLLDNVLFFSDNEQNQTLINKIKELINKLPKGYWLSFVSEV